MAFGVVISTDRHHHLVGMHLTGTGAEAITLPLALQSLDTDPLTHINIQVGGKAAHVVDDGVADHETLRVVAVVGEIGQPALPVGCHQAEAVPALVLPGMADAVLLQHQGLDAMVLKAGRHGQARLTGADDDNR